MAFQSCSFIFFPHKSAADFFVTEKDGDCALLRFTSIHYKDQTHSTYLFFITCYHARWGWDSGVILPCKLGQLGGVPSLVQAFMYHVLTLPEVPTKPRWIALGACVKGNGDWQDGAVMLYMSLQENLQRRISQLLWSFAKLYIHQKAMERRKQCHHECTEQKQNKTKKVQRTVSVLEIFHLIWMFVFLWLKILYFAYCIYIV